MPALAAHDHVLLIAHSLGSVIAYDTLWELSHDPRGAHPPLGSVACLITLGSPLGDEPLTRRLKGWRESGRGRFPANIRQWHNFSARGDAVCHDARLANDFRAMVTRSPHDEDRRSHRPVHRLPRT